MKNKNQSQQQAKEELAKTGHEYFMAAVDAEIRLLYHLQRSEATKRGIAAARKRKQCTN